MKKYQDEQEYTPEKLRKEREYGLFWYSWLWSVLRPVMMALCVCLVVGGIVMSGWNWIERHFFFPSLLPNDQTWLVSFDDDGIVRSSIWSDLD